MLIPMRVGRPIEFDPDVALHAAMHEFWAKGYEATSMRDLLACMQLSKSSFYVTFSSKELLFQQCIKRYRKFITKDLADALNNSTSGLEFIKQTLISIADEIQDGTARKGCLITNTASEFGLQNEDVSRLVIKSIRQFEAIFFKAINRAQVEGDISINKDSQVLAHYLVSNMSGLRTMVKAGMSRKKIIETVEVVLNSLVSN